MATAEKVYSGTLIEQLTAQVIAAEHNAKLREFPRCNQTDNLAGDTGERNGECGSLAVSACDHCGEMCEYHERFCSHERNDQ